MSTKAETVLSSYLAPCDDDVLEILRTRHRRAYFAALAAYEDTMRALEAGRVPVDGVKPRDETIPQGLLTGLPLRLAVSGKMGTGKTTLLKALGLPIASIGEEMKEDAAALFAAQGYPWLTVEHVRTYKDAFRSWLQAFPQAKRLVHGADWYVRRMLARTAAWPSVGCDDVRTKADMAALTAAGFIAIRLEASVDVRKERLRRLYPSITDAQLEHVTETDLDDYPFMYVFDAGQSLDVLAQQVADALMPGKR